MSKKLIRTLLLAAAVGFLLMWVLEFRRAGMLDSYWLLLLGLTFALLFQLSRLKQGLKEKEEIENQQKKSPPSGKKVIK